MSEQKPKPAETKNPVPVSQHPVLAAAIDHHKPADLREFSIPEWTDADGKPFDIYFWPWNLEDQDFFEQRAQPDMEGLKVYADIFIRKALDANGSKLFDFTHRKDLIAKVDPTVLIAACRIMMATKSKQDYLKNLRATPDAG